MAILLGNMMVNHGMNIDSSKNPRQVVKSKHNRFNRGSGYFGSCWVVVLFIRQSWMVLPG